MLALVGVKFNKQIMLKSFDSRILSEITMKKAS